MTLARYEDLSLVHQEILTYQFRKLNLEIAEYNFSNIYLFRNIHHYRLCHNNGLFLQGIARDGSRFLMPTFPLEKSDSTMLLNWLSEVDFFFPIPQHWLDNFDPDIFEMKYLDSESDYIFYTEKMRTYHNGHHLSAKRNLVKQFLTKYENEVVPLTIDRVGEALDVLERWQQEQDEEPENNDYYSCKEALYLIDKLPTIGYLFLVNKVPCGFMLGEELTTNCFVIHFTKALKSYKGLNQYLYQALALRMNPKYELMSLEQDLGSPTLRQAKHSYNPDLMVHKWRVSRKNKENK